MRARVQARRRRVRWPTVLLLLSLGLALALAAAGLVYTFVPGVRFRLQIAWAEVYDRLFPRPAVVPTVASAAAPPTFAPLATPTPPPSLTPAPVPSLAAGDALSVTATPTASPSLTPTPTPLPSQAALAGFTHEYQRYNNCGPASLSVNLSYWGWTGNQLTAAEALKPNPDDKNVSPRELYEFLLTQGYDAYIRVDGDLDSLKRFIAAGYPVLVEKGFTCQPGERCTGWFGHYSVFTGYDDDKRHFITQDTFVGPNLKLSYDDVLENWRAFNYLYLVIFPAGAERDTQVTALLGPHADVDQSYRDALARAQTEALSLTGEAAAFAWYNVGTNLVYFRDYAGAAAAFDQARQIGLPYRMLWYQFGPYLAYYYMARYQELVDLASFAIDSVTPGVVPGLEESYFWRGQAYEALGQRDLAVVDYRTALERHPDYSRALEALGLLGETP